MFGAVAENRPAVVSQNQAVQEAVAHSRAGSIHPLRYATMTCRVLGAALLGAAVLLVSGQEAGAFGKRSRGCDTPCATPCAPSCTVSYVDKVVVCYKPEWKTKKVEVSVTEYKMEPEKFMYKVCVPVMKKEKVKVCETKMATEPYKYTVMETLYVKDKVKVCESVWSEKEVPYSWYECVPVHTKQKRTVYETICVPTVVTHTVTVPTCAPVCAPACAPAHVRHGLFSRLCCKKPAPCPAPCATPCEAPCPPPCETKVVSHTVMVPKTTSKEIEVDICTYTQVKKDGVKKVKICTPVWVEKEVTVAKCVPAEKTGTRTVCVPVWVEKEIDVCTTTWADKEGVRHVCKPYVVKKWVEHKWCEMVKVETVVKVPVMVPCPTPCPTPTCCN